MIECGLLPNHALQRTGPCGTRSAGLGTCLCRCCSTAVPGR